MARLTVADLQQMKRDGKKIAAAVVYDPNMTRICERAGVDLLSVGDSLGRNVLGQDNPDDTSVEDMLPFARAVTHAAERGVVSVDMPRPASVAGPKAVYAACLRFKEAGADMVKVDGPACPEADGKIVVIFGAAGCAADTIDRTDRPSASKVVYDIAKATIDDIRLGKWESR